MLGNTRELTLLHDASGAFLGAFIGPELWEKTSEAILPILEAAAPGTLPRETPPEPAPEPMADLETLLAYWDFPYPPAYDLSCEHCGAHTEDWRADEPRQFRLTAANLGGLTAFSCQKCRSRILKRHFKKHVSVECRPFVDKA
jgi:hypothetical protein